MPIVLKSGSLNFRKPHGLSRSVMGLLLYLLCNSFISYEKLKKKNYIPTASFLDTYPIAMKARPPVRITERGFSIKQPKITSSRVAFTRYKCLPPQENLCIHYRSQNSRSERLRKSNTRYQKVPTNLRTALVRRCGSGQKSAAGQVTFKFRKTEDK